ncbi:MAG: hypothetical protein J1E65_01985 [Lachnospiraceae bacterium]|nr:hypothetical protein [Lachnospiraceae bacterium]
MPVHIPFKRVIQTMILSLATFAILLVWPLNIWSSYSYEGEINPDSMQIVQPEGAISQTFVPEKENLSYISFYIYNEDAYFPGGQMIFRLFDVTGELEKKVYNIEELTIPGLCKIPIYTKMDTETGYYFVIENPDAELLYAMEDGVSVDMQYAYKQDHLTWQGVGRMVLILVMAAGLCLLVEFLLRDVQGSFRFDLGFRIAVGLVVSGICLWFLWNVFPAKKFTTDPLNIAVLVAGILLLAAYCLYGLFHKREEAPENVISWKQIAGKLPGLLQTLAFAGVMTGGVNYLNALSVAEQKQATNLVYCSFALVVICSFTRKELLNWYNLVYMVIAIAAGIFYCLPYKEDLEQWDIAKGNAWCVALWGIVLCNIIRLLILERRPRYRISGIYTAAVVLLLASWISHRNGRTWPIEAAVFFGLFAVRVLFKGKRTVYLHHFCDGVFLHFLGISGYAFLYRPFHFYTHVRYGGIFHTVTAAAVYDCLVLVLAAGSFLVKYAKGKSLSALWKEIGMMGLSGGFLFLTASKTGIYTAGGLILLVSAVTAVTEYKEQIIRLVKCVGVLNLTVVAFSIIVFSACRLGPAVISKPFTYEIEWFPDSIKEGEAWDSFRFITVQKYLSVLNSRFTVYSHAEDAQNQSSDNGAEDDLANEPQSMVNSGNVLTFDVESLGGNLDYSNGRLEIFRHYLNALDWKGHVGVTLPDGSDINPAHAHNVYLQVAYDFGIAAGIGFIVFCVFAGIRSILYYVRHITEVTSVLPVLVLGVYGVCGLAEWVYTPFIPTGFAFFFVIVMMIPKEEKEQED